MNVTIVVRKPVETLYVAAEDVCGAAQAFDRLESRLPTLRGRRFYGALLPCGSYRACVKRSAFEDAAAMGLAEWTLPGGLYARTRINHWAQRVREIGPTFAAMASLHARDPQRPSVEFYRSQRDLILLMPVSAGAETSSALVQPDASSEV